MKRRSQPKAKEKPVGLSKYARKQLDRPTPKQAIAVVAQKLFAAPNVPTPPPPTELVEETTDGEWVVSGVVSGINLKGCLFVMTDGSTPERVFVPSPLLTNFRPAEKADRVHCAVTRNEHGLLATKVLSIEKPISA